MKSFKPSDEDLRS